MDSEGAYQIPKTIYVGDRGQLVFPLPPSEQAGENLTLSGTGLPENDEITVSKVEIDALNNRLLLTFRAWTPGQVEIPAFFAADRLFEGLHVNIASVLEAEASAGVSSLVLSSQAQPIAAPGTMWLGAGLFAALLFVAAVSLSIIRGKKAPIFQLLERLRKQRLRRIARRTLTRLRLRLEKDGKAATLERLSTEFRSFVSLYTGVNCRALVPIEFMTRDVSPFRGHDLTRLFSLCDTLRFSGQEIAPQASLACLNAAGEIISSLDSA